MMGCAPTYLTSKFLTRGQISDSKTRNSRQFSRFLYLCKTAAGHRTFQYKVANLWTSLHKDLKLCKGSVNFTKNLKANILEQFLKQE